MNQNQWLMRVEKGLSAHFKQENGPSRPGVMWAVDIKSEGSERVYKAMVKALFADNLLPELQKNQEYQAQVAMQYLKEKIQTGWHPENDIEHTIYISNPPQQQNVNPKEKKWWQFWK